MERWVNFKSLNVKKYKKKIKPTQSIRKSWFINGNIYR